MTVNQEKLQLAFEYAKAAHASVNQVRKYTVTETDPGQPYIVHPMAVVAILQVHGETDVDVLSAAYLHDVLEDVWPTNEVYSPQRIGELFGIPVWRMVDDLTDQFTFENYPAMNRNERKTLEAFRISEITGGALKVKLADLIHNTTDIVANDPGFAVVYLKEKRRVLRFIEERVRDANDPILSSLYAEALKLSKVTIPPKKKTS
jgi:(p)ppGpp synthase/HD superfamily hydrolase